VAQIAQELGIHVVTLYKWGEAWRLVEEFLEKLYNQVLYDAMIAARIQRISISLTRAVSPSERNNTEQRQWY
jgi:hypothetical protein